MIVVKVSLFLRIYGSDSIKRKEYNKYFLMAITLNGSDDKRYWRYINLAAVRFFHDYNSLSAVGEFELVHTIRVLYTRSLKSPPNKSFAILIFRHVNMPRVWLHQENKSDYA